MQVAHFQNLLEQANANINSLKEKVIRMFEEGFHYAKDQVRFLDPEFNLKPLGPYKRIVNNELVGSYS